MIYPRTFYIETYGCTYNQGDSEKIARLFLQFSYLPTSFLHAEIIVINTCAVKAQTEAKILHRIKSLNLQKGQKLLITGCLPWISDKILSKLQKMNENLCGMFRPDSYQHLKSLLHADSFPTIPWISREKNDQSKSGIIPWLPQKNSPGIVQISEGCNMACTYCCTRISRGRGVSFPLNDILDQIQNHIENGIKEIYLTNK